MLDLVPVLRSQSRSEPVLLGRSQCKDVKAKTCFLLLFSLFLYAKGAGGGEKKVPGAGASQKRTGSATLPSTCLYLVMVFFVYI